MSDATATIDDESTPPYQLAGVDLGNGWRVTKRIEQQPDDTGGYFSVGYECISDSGRVAFLKAIDLHKAIAISHADVVTALRDATVTVACERDLLDTCRRMDRVISILEKGDLHEIAGTRPTFPVPYMIFERATGNARTGIPDAQKTFAWGLRILQHTAVGLFQLHGRKIAHQDLKLSNILLFPNNEGAKVGDLGRAVQQGRSVPHDTCPWPGDLRCAPPEFYYGYVHSEFNVRRLAADLYLLGDCICIILTSVPIGTRLFTLLPLEFHPPNKEGPFTGTYSEVLPYLQQAFASALEEIRSAIAAHAPYADDVVSIIRQLCDPDPALRGHPRTRATQASRGNVFGLERYLTELDLLRHKAEMHEARNRTS